ncbi:MAG TPA: hypothetical protein VF892_05090 [Pseudonocardiaceae bacterium]
MRRLFGRSLVALVCGLAVATLVGTGTTTAAAATPADLGVTLQPTPGGDAGQCGGPRSQWVVEGDWTNPVRFDTDGRAGGCLLAFGIRDQADVLHGLNVIFTWQNSPNGDIGQCGNRGTFGFPITTGLATSPFVGVDTDDRSGWCNLSFTLSGRTDVALDVQWFADGDGGQCKNALPAGQYQTALNGVTIGIGDDTDGRPGGCQLMMRLRQF